ncbi:hypothetical protein [Bradyrhizobium sp. C9]|nr:hypothetical protein [Bradyrhizobium sp. C9]
MPAADERLSENSDPRRLDRTQIVRAGGVEVGATGRRGAFQITMQPL